MKKRIGKFANENPYVIMTSDWVRVNFPSSVYLYNDNYWYWQEWIEEHIQGNWEYISANNVAFSNREDAILFQLTWC